MPRASTLELEVERRRKISAAQKGFFRGRRKCWTDADRDDLAAEMRERWASRSDEQKNSIGAKISAALMVGTLAAPGQKKCRSCQQARHAEQFGPDARNNDGLQGRCRACVSKAASKWQASNPGKVLFFRRRRYGIHFEQMWDQQKGLCAICNLPMRLQGKQGDSACVDHDHSCCSTLARSCGKCVRGLVHSNCNRMLGQAKDNPNVLELGAAYLRRWEQLK